MTIFTLLMFKTIKVLEVDIHNLKIAFNNLSNKQDNQIRGGKFESNHVESNQENNKRDDDTESDSEIDDIQDIISKIDDKADDVSKNVPKKEDECKNSNKNDNEKEKESENKNENEHNGNEIGDEIGDEEESVRHQNSSEMKENNGECEKEAIEVTSKASVHANRVKSKEELLNMKYDNLKIYMKSLGIVNVRGTKQELIERILQ